MKPTVSIEGDTVKVQHAVYVSNFNTNNKGFYRRRFWFTYVILIMIMLSFLFIWGNSDFIDFFSLYLIIVFSFLLAVFVNFLLLLIKSLDLRPKHFEFYAAGEVVLLKRPGKKAAFIDKSQFELRVLPTTDERLKEGNYLLQLVSPLFQVVLYYASHPRTLQKQANSIRQALGIPLQEVD